VVEGHSGKDWRKMEVKTSPRSQGRGKIEEFGTDTAGRNEDGHAAGRLCTCKDVWGAGRGGGAIPGVKKLVQIFYLTIRFEKGPAVGGEKKEIHTVKQGFESGQKRSRKTGTRRWGSCLLTMKHDNRRIHLTMGGCLPVPLKAAQMKIQLQVENISILSLITVGRESRKVIFSQKTVERDDGGKTREKNQL